jgi:hypothetical protein
MALSLHIKKFIGTVLLVVWIAFYALIVMRLAVDILPGANGFAALLFYAAAGLLWIVPVRLALPWMNRDSRPRK